VKAAVTPGRERDTEALHAVCRATVQEKRRRKKPKQGLYRSLSLRHLRFYDNKQTNKTNKTSHIQCVTICDSAGKKKENGSAEKKKEKKDFLYKPWFVLVTLSKDSRILEQQQRKKQKKQTKQVTVNV